MAFSRKKLRRLYQMLDKQAPAPKSRVHVTTHADRRIRARLGTGTNTQIIAGRAWDQKKPVPKHWYFPHGSREKNVYYSYGECIFVFNDHKDGNAYLITIFGPYRPDGSWWKDGAWVRTD